MTLIPKDKLHSVGSLQTPFGGKHGRTGSGGPCEMSSWSAQRSVSLAGGCHYLLSE